MKYELVIKEEADREIADSFLYYENQKNGLGERFLSQLNIYFDRIKENPKHYQIKRKNYREAFIKNFPFLVIYEIQENKIVVYAVFNTSRNPIKKP